jgi:hypothetical protein
MAFTARLSLFLTLSFLSFPLCAQNSRDSDAYCTYQMEQAEAQRNLLRTPTAAGGLAQSETGLPTQIVGGASLGVADVKKAGLTMEVARRNCALYRSTTSVQQQLQYAIPMLEREALRNRLTLIGRADDQLNALTDTTRKMMEQQNATRLMLFSLETTRIKLEADRADTQSKIAAIYVPDLSATPLKEIVNQKQGQEVAEQQAEDQLNRQNNWNLALQVGVHQQVDPIAQGTQPYGSFSLSYNLASRSIDRHLDNAVTAYGDWKKVQEGDVIRNMDILHQQLNATIDADETKEQSLRNQMKEIDSNLQIVAAPDTTSAVDFRNQLESARLLLQIELDDTAFRLSRLRNYCSTNF